MVSLPVVTTFEITLPLSEPKNPLDRIATFAGPPRLRRDIGSVGVALEGLSVGDAGRLRPDRGDSEQGREA